MPYVVCEPCRDCKYTDCVVVCPCECFWQDEAMLYIKPDDCIDCGACEPECPVNAIFRDDAVPAPWKGYVELNLRRSTELAMAGTGHVTEKLEAKEAPKCKGTPA
jgi:ferredoxin